MKIILPDAYTVNPGDLSWDKLHQLGDTTILDYTPNDPDTVVELVGDAEAVIVNKIVMTAEMMKRCPNLKYIGVTATGYNIIDTAAAKERGIVVTNVPAYSTPSVAQFTFALLLELACHVAHHSDAVIQDKRWCSCRDFCFWDMPVMELDQKTMGIIGFGSIGRAVGRLAKAMGMRVLAAGSRPCEEGLAIADAYVDIDTLLAESDVVSLHCPLFPQTHHLINAESIAKMKDGALLLNTARGPLVEQDALTEALNTGKLGGAGLDVVDVEPMLDSNPLLHAKNCIITPHIAWASHEARGRLLNTVVENLRCWMEGAPQNVVNG